MFITLPDTEIALFWPGLILLGLSIGFITGMFGVGGGFLLTPCIRNIFGVPYEIAVGSDLVLICMNTFISTIKQWKKKAVDVKLGMVMICGALSGTEIGGRFLKFLGNSGTFEFNGRQVSLMDTVMNGVFLISISFIALSMYRETKNNSSNDVSTPLSRFFHHLNIVPQISLPHSGISSISVWIPFCMAGFVGFLTGFLGIGGGFLTFPLLVYVVGIPTLNAVGTNAFMVVFSSLYGALRNGNIALPIVLLLFSGSFIGVHYGVKVSHVIGGHNIRKNFIYVLMAGILVVTWGIVRDLFIM
jgi:uncharacterized protein